MKKKISIVTPTYNEDQNIEKLIFEIKKIMDSLQSKYDYEHIVIDNRSTDNTINILKKIAKENKNLKIIISRMKGWQLTTFKDSYDHKIKEGVSLFKKNLLKKKL